MTGADAHDQVLNASTTVVSALLTNIAAAGVVAG